VGVSVNYYCTRTIVGEGRSWSRLSDTTPTHGARSSLAQRLKLFVVSGALSVTKRSNGLSLPVVKVASLCCGEHLHVTASSARHGVSFGASIVDHGWQLASSCIDEPIGDLVHLQSCLPHEILLLVLGWIRVLKVCHKPCSQFVRRLLGQVASSLSLFAVTAQAGRSHLSKSNKILVRCVICTWRKRCTVE
jgi:hypothetical protein